MSAPALASADGPSLRIRGVTYPVLLPTLRDARLHLAAVIVTLQVLGQVAFDFSLSIAQILVSLATCAILETGIAFARRRVIMWPASALLTGNGVAFILRVPGTEHGDWWSMNGWWIFAGTAAVSLLSKYVIRRRGRHIFNPSNFGLVLCFLVLGRDQAEPLDFWWGPLSPALVLALVVIVTGGLAILSRLRLLTIAVGFWLSFAAGIGVLALAGHEMLARWHLGPIEGGAFWWVLVTSPEVLVFLFFMITDPRTVPEGRAGRRAFAVGVGVLATLLIAPLTSEYATKVALLSALALVCAARPLVELAAGPVGRLGSEALVGAGHARRVVLGAVALAASAVAVAFLLVVGAPSERAQAADGAGTTAGALPAVTVTPSAEGVASRIDRPLALRLARDVVLDLRAEAVALGRGDEGRAAQAADGAWLAALWRRIRAGASAGSTVPVYDVTRMHVGLQRAIGQGQPRIVARLSGTVALVPVGATPVAEREGGRPFTRTVELELRDGRYLVTASRGGVALGAARAPVAPLPGAGARFQNVAAGVGLDFRHGAFRFGVSNDTTAMMGGGLCWLDYDDDGWLDLFVVNTYADPQYARWLEQGGAPRSALFHNERGRFVDVSRASGADLAARGSGCVAADFDLDGHTDLYVTTAGYTVQTDAYDALLWNQGDGTFREGARAAGIDAPGWHTGAAVGDVNGDGRPDLFVAGYTDVNAPLPGSSGGFPSDHAPVRDLLYVNEGRGPDGHAIFREVGRQAGLEPTGLDHGLGATFTDVDGDGRADLYVANDLDPNRLYLNRPAPRTSLGFRLVERGAAERVDDANAGMGIAAADYDGDGVTDLFVTNSRGQLHAVYRGSGGTRPFADVRSTFVAASGTRFTGWGASWADVDLDGDLDLVLANGAIPVRRPRADAQPVQVLGASDGGFVDASAATGTAAGPRVNGRGLAAADFDNDGDLDVAVNGIGGPLVLLRNTGATGHWLEVRLRRFAPGTVVTAVLPGGERLVREARAGSSYLSSEDPRLHFGLGSADTVEALIVRRPDGTRLRLDDVRADRVVVVP